MRTSLLLSAASIVAIFLGGCGSGPAHKCDPSIPETTPSSRFDLNKIDGSVFDRKTNLIWKICSEGQTYSDGLCSGEAATFNWNNAIQNFGLEGKVWRLPNADELSSIAEKRCSYPFINTEIFPQTPSEGFWSSSSHIAKPSLAWNVSFSTGGLVPYSKGVGFYVRLVRGEQWFDPLQAEIRKKEVLASKEELAANQATAAAKAATSVKDALAAAKVENEAYISCKDKASCDKAFSLTQIYINTMASQKIQVATDTIIETYNPTEYGNVGMGAVKIPGKGSSATIRLSVTCKTSESGHFENYCAAKQMEIYKSFRPFVSKMLNE